MCWQAVVLPVATLAARAELDAHFKAGEEMNRCQNCVYVLERIKDGFTHLLPNICEEVLEKTDSQESYATVRSIMITLLCSTV